MIPPKPTIAKLRQAARDCRACPLWENGIQTVFGEGGAKAKVVFVGEQPGFDEDRSGKPFVGPAGKLLNKALERAGIPRTEAYVTNAVKHFKWEPKGQLHLHKKPNAKEIAACFPWLEAELKAIKPAIVVCLGATAAQTLLGKDFRVTQHRGEWFSGELAPRIMATVHPSSILRAPSDDARHVAMDLFVQDLKKVAAEIGRGGS